MIVMRFVKSFGMAAGCFLLSACVSMQVSQQSGYKKQTVKRRQLSLLRLHSWRADGAFSIIQQDNQTIANYKWRQSGRSSFNLQIFGPLSMGLVTINAQPGQVVLQQGKKTLRAASANALLQDDLG